MMDTINFFYDHFIESLYTKEITLESSIIKLLLSLILGGIVGIERKRKGQLAGVRTFALISMGSTLAMILSIYIPQLYLGEGSDPTRIAAQVITGIGFLGAGAIIQTKGSIRGLTTAAGIWMVATIGLSVGVGMYKIAIASTLFILFTLISLERYEHRLLIERTAKIIRITCQTMHINVDEIKNELKKNKITIHDQFVEYDYDKHISTIEFVVLVKKDTDYQSLFNSIQEEQPAIKSIVLRNEIN